MTFEIQDISTLEERILTNRSAVQNFPKSLDFPFSDWYRSIVTPIKTTIIAGDSILYNAPEAVNESKEFNTTTLWCFAGSGTGDRWLLDKDEMVFYYDHDYDEGFVPLYIMLKQWLQMSFLFRQLEDYIDSGQATTDAVITNFKNTLKKTHPDLEQNYPYLISSSI
ncbi:hypothetical protein [Sphingobacterium faecale]|uniref:SMI1/KNR4 family protein n=1 Tax=Sphingobacterium faecale TaxID=2803775 RepID=A0ABS1R0U9_9SPHI|nr:hypothetical protein [Sphingobacterium faecale]MBL1408288.1 hypothetical protein [Sphingobacterium faecale]